MSQEAKKSRRTKPKDFETALNRLETIVEQLDAGGLSLEKSMKLFEEGQQLAEVCAEQLDEADKKIEVLIRQKNRQRDVELTLDEDDDIDERVEEALADDDTE
jgi:exodeoxyribonuclease VII small subunit